MFRYMEVIENLWLVYILKENYYKVIEDFGVWIDIRRNSGKRIFL